MNCDLTHLSNSNDRIKTNILLSLITKYSNFKSHQRSHRTLIRNSTLTNSPAYVPRYLSPYNLAPLNSNRRATVEIYTIRDSSLSTPKSKNSAYSIDQLLTLQNIFSRIADSYSHTAWVRMKKEPEISIIVIRQFWLDCYVCDSGFYKKLMKPIQTKDWVNSELFVKSFEEVHSQPNWRFFPSKKVIQNTKLTLLNQKLLCKNLFSFLLRY